MKSTMFDNMTRDQQNNKSKFNPEELVAYRSLKIEN